MADLEELKKSIDNLDKKRMVKEKNALFNNLLSTLADDNKEPRRISLPSNTGYIFLDVYDILWCKAEGNYTILKTSEANQVLTTTPFRKIEDTLPSSLFIRVHNSYLINKEKVRHLVKSDGYILMADNVQVPLSRYRKDAVLEQLLT